MAAPMPREAPVTIATLLPFSDIVALPLILVSARLDNADMRMRRGLYVR